MDNVSVLCFLASYTLAAVFSFLRLRKATTGNRLLTLGLTGAGFVAHTMYLMVRSRNAELPPLMASSHDWLLVAAWVAVVCFLFLSMFDAELPLGAFVLPAVLGLVVAARFVSLEPNALLTIEDARRGWVILHTATLVFGMVGVLASLILALMYLLQHRRLKLRQEGVHLPSLARLARWNRWAVVFSVPTLSLGMAAGILLGAKNPGESRDLLADPIVIGSGLGWIVMIIFFGWLTLRDRPAARQVALITIWACGFLLLTVVGLQVITGTGHSTGRAESPARTS